MCSLEQGFFKDFSVSGWIHPSFNFHQSLCPCHWEAHPIAWCCSHRASLWGWYWQGAWCSPNIVVGVMPKEFNFVSSDQKIFFLMLSESFKCCLANSKRVVICLFHLATLPSRPEWWSAAVMITLPGGSKLLLHFTATEATMFLGTFKA